MPRRGSSAERRTVISSKKRPLDTSRAPGAQQSDAVGLRRRAGMIYLQRLKFISNRFGDRQSPQGRSSMSNTRSILVVDDDVELAGALSEQLALHEEFEPRTVDTAAKALAAVKDSRIDLALMDVGLPDMDGREAVKLMRRNGFRSPIIMLTGHDTDSDAVLGLESGANDYVVKPFRFSVLLARIRAHLRQHEASEDAVFTIGHYTFRPSAKLLVAQSGSKLKLTEKETAILRFLYRAGGKVVTRDVL